MYLYIAGGVGKSGCSSYYIRTEKNSFFIDAGVEEGKTRKYPLFRAEEVKKAEFLFITHHHKDHTGAIERLVEMGFKGRLVMSEETFSSMEAPEDTVILKRPYPGSMDLGDGLSVTYGRTGHCLGSLWYYIKSGETCIFTTGDMNMDSRSFIHDVPAGISADLSLLEAGEGFDIKGYTKYREELKEYIEKNSQNNFLFPLQADGRGLEMFCFIAENFKDSRIFLDEKTEKFIKKAMDSKTHVTEKAVELFNKHSYLNTEVLEEKRLSSDGGDFILAGDAAMKEERTRRLYLNHMDENLEVIITGSLKEGTYSEKLVLSGRAKKMKYINHQNVTDCLEIIKQNNFKRTVFIHSHEPIDIADSRTAVFSLEAGETLRF